MDGGRCSLLYIISFICLDGLRKATKASFNILGIPVDNRTSSLSNTSNTKYCLSLLALITPWSCLISHTRSTQPPIQWVPGLSLRQSSRGVALNTPPPNPAPRLKKEYSYDLVPLWAFVARSRLNFTFYKPLLKCTLFTTKLNKTFLVNFQPSRTSASSTMKLIRIPSGMNPKLCGEKTTSNCLSCLGLWHKYHVWHNPTQISIHDISYGSEMHIFTVSVFQWALKGMRKMLVTSFDHWWLSLSGYSLATLKVERLRSIKWDNYNRWSFLKLSYTLRHKNLKVSGDVAQRRFRLWH